MPFKTGAGKRGGKGSGAFSGCHSHGKIAHGAGMGVLVAVANGVSVGNGVFVAAVVGMAVGAAGGGIVGRGVDVFAKVGVGAEVAVVGTTAVFTPAIPSSVADWQPTSNNEKSNVK